MVRNQGMRTSLWDNAIIYKIFTMSHRPKNPGLIDARILVGLAEAGQDIGIHHGATHSLGAWALLVHLLCCREVLNFVFAIWL